MNDEEPGEVTLEAVQGFAQASGLPYDRARLVELAPKVAGQQKDMASLWDIDVTGYEMAITFPVDERAPA